MSKIVVGIEYLDVIYCSKKAHNGCYCEKIYFSCTERKISLVDTKFVLGWEPKRSFHCIKEKCLRFKDYFFNLKLYFLILKIYFWTINNQFFDSVNIFLIAMIFFLRLSFKLFFINVVFTKEVHCIMETAQQIFRNWLNTNKVYINCIKVSGPFTISSKNKKGMKNSRKIWTLPNAVLWLQI